MHRLFSTFASGPPGLGLLLLRLIAAAGLIAHYGGLHNGASPAAITCDVIAMAGGLLLLVGLWTPLVGAIVAMTELCIVFSHSDDLRMSITLAVLAAALALIGPGIWSVDARLYGWKRIEIRRPEK